MIPFIVLVVFLLIVGFFVWRRWGRAQQKRSDAIPTGQGGSPIAANVATSFDPLQLDANSGTILHATADHTRQQGQYLGRACELAYLNESEGKEKFLQQLNLSVRLISVDNTQAYVGENAESIVIAFRGSERPNTLDGFKDWLLTNARNFLVLPEGRIGTDFAAAGVGARFHRGFMEALAEIWEPLIASVEEAVRRKERPVWVTGHSLGGAIALLAAWRFHQKFISIHHICTFGAPMIGNNAAAEAYHREFPNKITRYVDHSDMVPRLPTMSLLSNEYDHVQREIIVGEESARSAKRLLANAAGDSTDGEVDQLIADNLWGELNSGIAAHMMDNYLSRLSEAVT